MKKIIKFTTTVLLAFIMMIASMISAKAASSTIDIGQSYKVGNNYINDTTFSYKVTTDGRYLYCLDLHRDTASNVTANLVSNSSYVDGGILYILKNAYPEKSITGDNDKDYYITQTAIWWYLDSTHGMSNLSNGFKYSGSDPYDLRKYVSDLVTRGITHRYDVNNKKTTTLEIAPATSKELVLENNYYVSNSIRATKSSNITEYTVTIDNPVKDITIIPSTGQEFSYHNSFKIGVNDSFKIKVPASSITKGTTLNITATATGNTYYNAYEYQPTNSSMQNVVLLEKTPTSAKATTSVSILTTKIAIKKVDETTNKPLAGAVLVVKNEQGKEITRWTSTINDHVIENIAPGTYTLEEVSAPEGYILNKTPITFKINTNRVVYTLTMKNTPKNIVININKIDSETKKTLSGAVLVIKNSAGKVVERFVTEDKAHVITDIPYGTYTVEEETAPTGYIKSNEKVTFTVDDNHQSHQITITNTKETPVPDTGTESIIFVLIGTIILGIGLDFILKHAKA